MLFRKLLVLVMLRSTSVKQRDTISRMNEHGTQNTEPMFKYLSKCQIFKETCNSYHLPSVCNEKDQNEIHMWSHILSTVL